MSIPESNSLFQGSGSQEILNYFLSHLQAGDLSSEEALAILSAVHADLGKGPSVNSRIYQSYSIAMKSLEQTMPDVFDYVVSTWNKEKKTGSADGEQQGTDFNEVGDTGRSEAKSPEASSGIEVKELKISEGEVEAAEESPEAEELDENETHQKEEFETDDDHSEGNEALGETKENEIQEKEDEGEEKEDLNEGNEDKSVAEVEAEDSKDEETDVSNADDETGEIESEKVEISDEFDSGSEKGAGESEVTEAPEQEETEWPEIEQPTQGESSDGFEEETPIPPED